MSPSKSTSPYPVANATASYWRSEPHALDEHRSTPQLPERSDVVIVGAGFCGATAAYCLLKESSPSRPSVTVLEAREACSGATGRNGGHLRPDVFLDLVERSETDGLDVANEIALFEVANADAVAKLVEDESIECELRKCTTGYAFLDEQEARRLKLQYDGMLGKCPTMKNVAYHGPSEAEQLTSVRGAKAAFTFPAATLWPYKLVMGLLERAVQKGLNLQTNTPVLEVSESADQEGYWNLSTPRGDTKARQVIFATNAYTGGILPQYKDDIVPVRGLMGRVVPMPKPSFSTQILHSSATKYLGFEYDYHAIQPDGSLVVGGAFVPHRKHPSRYNVSDDSTLYEGTDDLFEGWAQKCFRGWEDVETKVENTWTGIMGTTPDKLPHIGRVPEKPGQFICAAFNGHGMPNVFLSAKGIVQMMQTGCSLSDTGVPSCYETSPSRLQNWGNKEEVDGLGISADQI
ncbi:FAD dependent oxidoreductase [Seiridium cupressi]